MHVANLLPHRWVKRVLRWNPNGARKRGYARQDWKDNVVAYARIQQLGRWQMLAQDPVLWMQVNDDFVQVAPLVDVLVSHWLRLKKGCPRTCWRKIKVKVKLAFPVALEKRRMQFNPLAE